MYKNNKKRVLHEPDLKLKYRATCKSPRKQVIK
jgi:hypothetical protein